MDEVCTFAGGFNKNFVLFDKIDVNGSNTHPLYAYLKEKCPGTLVNTVKWNFTKVG